LSRDEKILLKLLSNYKRCWNPRTDDPFKSLVRTILSQNTNYKNEATAFEQLENLIGVTPQNLAESSVKEIAEAIRPAGMYNQRSVVLNAVAKEVIDRFTGDLASVLEMPYYKAREALMELTGVGPKTADVVLIFDGGNAIIPVDRHIFRISKRLKLVPEKAGYEVVRETLEKATPKGRHEDVHVFLIRFGREYCKALNPRCVECFLADLCPSIEI
jgi:endonuclease-3